MHRRPRTEGTLKMMVSERFGMHVKVGYSRKPNLKRYIASVGCSAYCVYAGGSDE